MPENDGQGATPNATDATSGQTEGQQTSSTQSTDNTEPTDEVLKEAGRKAIQAEREARRAAQEKVRTLEAELEALKTKDLPEGERIKAENARLKEKLDLLEKEQKDQEVRFEVTRLAAKLGIVDTDVALLLLQRDEAIEFDKEGRPTNVEAALKVLVKDKPYLTRAVSGGADAGAGTRAGGATPGANMNDLLRRAAGRG